MIQEEQIQTLMDFGLTSLQAKTYLALAQLGKADVKTIAKASNVARQDIYRIMPTLQKLGLGEKIIAKPTLYKATPIKEGVSILLQNIEKEHAELQEKTTSLIDTFQEKNAKIFLQEDSTQFTITSEITRFLKMHKSLTKQAQTSIDGVIPLSTSQPRLHECFLSLKGAIRRGVKICLVIKKVEKQLLPRQLQGLEKNSLFEVKYSVAPVHFGMFIFDRKEVTLATNKGGLPSLWSNNPNVVKLANTYFNEMWNKNTSESVY
jgi:sugar-specific transcriptional regulator TrmB